MDLPRKIVSGGQTGVDRAALDAALALDFPCGGWCPAGRFDEHATIPARYPLTEMTSGGYKQRTIQNIVDSDGTLIFYFADLEGGTAETLFRCSKLGRPFKLIDGREVPISRAVKLAAEFVARKQLQVLNVAGPRASKSPEGYAYALTVMTGLLKRCGSSKRPASQAG